MKRSINLWAVTADAPGAVLLAWTLDKELEQALAVMPSDLRRCVQIVNVEGIGSEEAAYILGIPAGTLKLRLAQGRMKLHDFLQEMGKAHAELRQ